MTLTEEYTCGCGETFAAPGTVHGQPAALWAFLEHRATGCAQVGHPCCVHCEIDEPMRHAGPCLECAAGRYSNQPPKYAAA